MVIVNTLFALIFLLSFFLLISYSDVVLTLERKTRLEITFAFIKLELYNFGSGKKTVKHPPSFYKSLLKRVNRLFERCVVYLNKLWIPSKETDAECVSAFTSQICCNIAISAFLAYIQSKVQRLYIEENAIIFTKEKTNPTLILTARGRLFYIVITMLLILLDLNKAKRNESKKYVGNKNG